MKKLITLGLAGIMGLSMIGCGGAGSDAGSGKPSIKIWCSQADQYSMGLILEEFQTQNPDVDFKVKLGVVGEDVAATQVSEDAAAAADIFVCPEDHLSKLQTSSAIYTISDVGDNMYKTEATANNSEKAIAGATIDGELMAFPLTGDNTYFMFYDKRVLVEDDLATFDTVMDACEADGKTFIFDMANGFYNAGLFFSAGCTIGIGEDGEQLCDFNNEKGLLAARACEEIVAHKAFKTGDNTVITGSVGLGGTSEDLPVAGAAITGSWNYNALKKNLGDNLGFAVIPQVKIGEDYVDFKSFGGHKYVCVKKTTQQAKLSLDLASFISGEYGQKLRFEQGGYVPTNNNVLALDAVKNDPLSSVIASQMANSVSQAKVTSYFWDPAGAFGTDVIEKAGTPMEIADLQILLDTMVDGMKSV